MYNDGILWIFNSETLYSLFLHKHIEKRHVVRSLKPQTYEL